jgi:lysophospholipase L1-like esterase
MAAYVIHWPSANHRPRVQSAVKGISDCLDRICEGLSIPFLPIWDHLFASAIWFKEAEAGDGIHPNSDGYEVLTNLVNSWQPWRSWFDEDQTAPSCCSAKPDVHLKK